jgi:CheY-like chemotaxis protein
VLIWRNLSAGDGSGAAGALNYGKHGALAHMPLFPSERPVILIVEDEFLIRMTAADAIREAGYEVLEAADTDQAIEILESRQDIRVVFTDIHMPGSMDGVKLAHAIRHRWPPVRIIATSSRQILRASDFPVGTVFLSKPYSPDDIVWKLDALTAA